jgi:hypothetical protein
LVLGFTKEDGRIIEANSGHGAIQPHSGRRSR